MSEAQRISQFASVPLGLAEMVVDRALQANCPLKLLRSECFQRDIVHIRWAIAREAHEAGFSYAAIGRALNRDHTTIMHAIKVAAR